MLHVSGDHGTSDNGIMPSVTYTDFVMHLSYLIQLYHVPVSLAKAQTAVVFGQSTG